MSHETIYVVFETNYGADLEDLPSDAGIWLVESEANRNAADRGWAQDEVSKGSAADVTLFEDREGASDDVWLRSVLESILDHHGEDLDLRVIGMTLSEAVKEALAEQGFEDIGKSEEGFRARLHP